MTLLTICQAAANIAPVSPPATIIGNTDETASLLLALANLAGNSISRRPQGGWVSMIKEYDFTTQASTLTYSGSVANSGAGGVAVITINNGADDTTLDALDGAWVASGTALLNNTTVSSVSSSGSPDYVYTITCNMPATSATPGTYQFGKSDYSLPSDFERAIDNTFWDRTRYWSMRGPQSPQQWQVYKSSVIGRASIQRRYRFREILGTQRISIDPTPFDNGSSLVFEYVSNAWCKSSGGTPQTSWQADTDTGVIDEYLIQLYVQYMLLRRLGLSYSEELAEYERQLDKAIAQDGASAILDLTPNNYLTLIGPWNLPETNFGQGGYGGFIIGVSEIGGPGLG